MMLICREVETAESLFDVNTYLRRARESCTNTCDGSFEDRSLRLCKTTAFTPLEGEHPELLIETCGFFLKVKQTIALRLGGYLCKALAVMRNMPSL